MHEWQSNRDYCHLLDLSAFVSVTVQQTGISATLCTQDSAAHWHKHCVSISVRLTHRAYKWQATNAFQLMQQFVICLEALLFRGSRCGWQETLQDVRSMLCNRRRQLSFKQIKYPSQMANVPVIWQMQQWEALNSRWTKQGSAWSKHFYKETCLRHGKWQVTWHALSMQNCQMTLWLLIKQMEKPPKWVCAIIYFHKAGALKSNSRGKQQRWWLPILS